LSVVYQTIKHMHIRLSVPCSTPSVCVCGFECGMPTVVKHHTYV